MKFRGSRNLCFRSSYLHVGIGWLRLVSPVPCCYFPQESHKGSIYTLTPFFLYSSRNRDEDELNWRSSGDLKSAYRFGIYDWQTRNFIAYFEIENSGFANVKQGPQRHNTAVIDSGRPRLSDVRYSAFNGEKWYVLLNVIRSWVTKCLYYNWIPITRPLFQRCLNAPIRKTIFFNFLISRLGLSISISPIAATSGLYWDGDKFSIGCFVCCCLDH